MRLKGYGNFSPQHMEALAAALTSPTSYYVEEGAEIGADSVARPVWCVLDGATHEQVGEAFSSAELAQLVANDWNGG